VGNSHGPGEKGGLGPKIHLTSRFSRVNRVGTKLYTSRNKYTSGSPISSQLIPSLRPLLVGVCSIMNAFELASNISEKRVQAILDIKKKFGSSICIL
jgi:hypothetical protein